MNTSVALRPQLHRLPVPLWHTRPKATPPPQARLPRYRLFSASSATPSPRRPYDFNSGFSSTYDPSQDTGRGPIFKPSYGVPQFYPRDLKARVDEYVVGQDRAKKTICSSIFNHYQNLRRRRYDQDSDRRFHEKLQRQKWARDRDRHAEPHPVEGQCSRTLVILPHPYLRANACCHPQMNSQAITSLSKRAISRLITPTIIMYPKTPTPPTIRQ